MGYTEGLFDKPNQYDLKLVSVMSYSKAFESLKSADFRYLFLIFSNIILYSSYDTSFEKLK